jgi:phage/plasmid-associated DNA primase
MAANHLPKWTDNAGSLGRRIVLIEFLKKILRTDQMMEDKLVKEMPSLLLKFNRAYLVAANQYRCENLWTVLPPYFKKTQEEITQTLNPLESFLASEEVKYSHTYFVSRAAFVAAFNSYCSANSLGKHPFIRDFYAPPFSNRDLELETGTVRNDPIGGPRKGTWVVGVTLVTEADNIAEGF